MNIFILDLDFKLNVQYHVDKHIVKMPTELAQMLSTAVRLNNIDIGYKITHKNHPCNIWTRESLSNWFWLKTLAEHLNDEWKYRYNHKYNHKSFDVIQSLPIPNIKDKGLTPFPLCMPIECIVNNDPVVSYQKYYNTCKTHLFAWKKREKPNWIING